MLYYDASGRTMAHNKTRPSRHSNQKTYIAMLEDLISQGALNDAETIVEGLFAKTTGSLAPKVYKTAASKIKSGNVLSTNGMAVCHKIPFGGFQRCLEELAFRPTAASVPWGNLSSLIGDLNGVGGSYISFTTWNAVATAANNFQIAYAARTTANTLLATATKAAQKTPNLMTPTALAGANSQALAAAADEAQTGALYCTEANSLLAEFDGCPDNLYFGFQSTNASISDNIDQHFHVNSAGSATATPRGVQLTAALNTLEKSLGLPATSKVEVVDSFAVTWCKTSGVDNIGWVEV